MRGYSMLLYLVMYVPADSVSRGTVAGVQVHLWRRFTRYVIATRYMQAGRQAGSYSHDPSPCNSNDHPSPYKPWSSLLD